MPVPPALMSHLASGTTTLCHCWALTRADGQIRGFTDHDRDLEFEGIQFRAGTGLTARALEQGTGLAVDNSEAFGVLSDAAITEADILAGRLDGAVVRCWLVNWANPDDRMMQFRGSIGEIRRAGGAFSAELRGLSEVLNTPQGRIYQAQCGAILGDRDCSVDLSAAGYSTEREVEVVEERRVFRFHDFRNFDDRWFERGRFLLLSGAGAGLVGYVKNDRLSASGREIELWQELDSDIVAGDMVRIEAGCDKRTATCRLKFNNFVNFRGFPHIPGEDWLMTYPRRSDQNDGGRLR